MRLIDLTHVRFGKLRVIKRAGTQTGMALWLCLCDCGNKVEVRTDALRRRNFTRSCGCYSGSKTHGLSKTAEYRLWKAMRGRCYNENNSRYKDYGGRGIFVEAAWEDFAVFIADMGKRPRKGMSLERIDNDGPYASWNCKWATNVEQSRNRRNRKRYICENGRKYLTYKGETMFHAEWARRYHLSVRIIGERVKRGWTPEQVLTLPPNRNQRVRKRR